MKQLICKVTGHNLKNIQKENFLIKEYQCTKCKEKFTTDGYGHLVKLNRYWEKNNVLFEKNYQSTVS